MKLLVTRDTRPDPASAPLLRGRNPRHIALCPKLFALCLLNLKHQTLNLKLLLKDKSIAAVVPAYNEENQIVHVIETMPEFVDHFMVVRL
jgi:hypothetical protein